MLIIGRIYLFLNWLVIFSIIGAVALILLRWVANYADLNPFAWPSLTIRRLTDPFLMPIRRGLTGFGVDPKYAPLVLILIAVLLGWFVLQLVGTIANTLAGVLVSLQHQDLVPLVGYVLYGFLAIYSLLIFIRIIFSWGMVGYGSRTMRCLFRVTEPLLGPLRRIVPPVGMFDISPIVAFIIVWLFQAAVQGTLLRNMPVRFFA